MQMMARKTWHLWPLRLAPSALLVMLIFADGAMAQSTTVGATGDFFDKFITSGTGTAYGAFLKTATDSVTPELYKDLDWGRQAIGRFSVAVDVITKVEAGKYDEAALSAALKTIQEIAGTKAGTDLLSGLKLSTLTVNVAVTAVKVWMASEKAVKESARALQLESLYGRIQGIAKEPRLRNRSRALGEGDPIPITPASIDYVWKAILASEDWRGQFKIYVTELLQADWPDASYWESWTLSSGDAKKLEAERLSQKEQEFKVYIASLLADLNNKQKVLEQEVLVRQAFLELKDKIGRYGDLEAVLVRFGGAMQRLPALEEFTKRCPAYIQNAQEIKSQRSLEDLMEQSKGFAENVLQYIPAKGIYAADRTRLLGLLKSCYSEAKGTIPAVAKEQREEIEQPAATGPSQSSEPAPDAYAKYFKSLIVPYAWSVDPNSARSSVLDALMKGDWKTAEDTYAGWMGKDHGGTARGKGEPYGAHYAGILGKVTDLYGKTRSPLSDQLLAAEKSCSAIWTDSLGPRDACFAEAERVKGKDASACMAIQERASLATRACREGTEKPLRREIEALDAAWVRAKTVVSYLLDNDEALFRETSQSMEENFSAVNALAAEKRGQLAKLREDLTKFDERLPLGKPLVVTWIENELASLRNNTWPGVTPAWMGGGAAAGFGLVMEANANTLRERARSLRGSVEWLDGAIMASEEAWNFAVRDWQAFYRTIDLRQEDYDMITLLADRSFSRDEVERYEQAARGVPSLLSAARMKHGEYRTLVGTEEHNLSTDAAWLSSLVAEFTKWMTEKQKAGLPYFQVSPGLVVLTRPYAHYLTKSEVAVAAAEGRRLKIYEFVKKYMPSSLSAFDGILAMDAVALAEDNFILAGATAVYSRQMDRAAALLAELKPELGAAGYGEALKEIASVLPLTLERSNGEEDKARQRIAINLNITYTPLPWEGRLLPVDETRFNFSLGRSYLDLRNDIGKALLTGQAHAQAERKAAAEKSSREEDVRNEAVRVASLAEQAAALNRDREEIRALYNQFKQAYESRDESAVCSLIGEDWQTADGTTVSDLRATLMRTFRVFDEVRYGMGNLTINKTTDGKYTVSYDVTITSRIYKRNLKHEEKSSVDEEVTLDASGRPKISRTLGGRFWYAQ